MIQEFRFLFVITTRMKIDYVCLLKSTKNEFSVFKKKDKGIAHRQQEQVTIFCLTGGCRGGPVI